jgi:carbon-monoxide dehydrogenase large subunit
LSAGVEAPAPPAETTAARQDSRHGRREDKRLVTGRGRYTTDILPDRVLHAHFVRSPLPHARVAGLDASAALELPGVVGVWAADDIAQLGAQSFPMSWITEGQRLCSTPLLARDAVRFVGQQIAVVVAGDPYLAEDAAELVRVDLEPRPVLANVEDSLRPDAPLLYEEWGTNVIAEIDCGGGDVDAAFEQGAVRVRRTVRVQRQAVCPMEGRAVVAAYDAATDRVVAHISTQGAHHARDVISRVCGWDRDDLRVVCPDVGGGFGTKEYPYAEDALVCLLARTLRRTVRWIEDRREGFLSSGQARETTIDLELAATAEGRVLGVRGTLDYDLGGQPSGQGIGPARFGADLMTGPYAIGACLIRARGVVTTKVPAGAYRGYGAPQACFAIERLLDTLADELGLDRVEVRRRNLISAEQQPWHMPSGLRVDSGDYPAALESVVERLDLSSLRREQRKARADGRLIGMGVVPHVMASGMTKSSILGQSGQDHGSFETAHVRMDSSARVVVFVGTSSQGQGHETALAGLAADRLGVADEAVRVVGGDTDMTPYSPVSAAGSRVGPVVASTVQIAADQVADKLRRLAAHQLGCASSDIELRDGHACRRSESDQQISLRDIAHAAHTAFDLPDGEVPGLEGLATLDPEHGTFSFAVHAAVVEVDPRMGAIDILRYVALHDCGRRLNPAIVEGQVLGGLAQGLGAALLEDMRYDPETGQPVTTSFLDYLLPTAATMPDVELMFTETPTAEFSSGAKGIAEAGIIAPPAVIAAAVEDAVRPGAGQVLSLPITPPRVLELIGG